MVGIGILKATGFRSKQIVRSVALQFGIMAALGSFAGVMFAQLGLVFAGRMFEGTIGLLWRPVFIGFYMVITFAFVVLLITLFSQMSAWRVKKIHPLNALRGDMSNRIFKKNHMTLDKSRGSLGLVLSAKQLLQSKKQAVMIGIIITVLAAASVGGVAAHYNLNINPEAFMLLDGGEIPDITIILDENADFAAFKDIAAAHPEIQSINGRLQTLFTVNGLRTLTAIVQDTSLLQANILLEGRYPMRPNEITLGFMAMQAGGLSIGDYVEVSSENDNKQFIITGITQAGGLGGFGAMMTAEGYDFFAPNFEFWGYLVYLTPGAHAAYFAIEMQALLGDDLISARLSREEALSTYAIAGDIFAPVAYAMVGVTAAVVVLVLYMVINANLLRRRRELGIKKALGFTTLQLMNQITLSITPPLLVGIAAGAIIGYFSFNPAYGLITRGMGVAQPGLPIPINWVVAVCVLLMLLAYATSMILSLRIRKISAYDLVTQ